MRIRPYAHGLQGTENLRGDGLRASVCVCRAVGISGRHSGVGYRDVGRIGAVAFGGDGNSGVVGVERSGPGHGILGDSFVIRDGRPCRPCVGTGDGGMHRGAGRGDSIGYANAERERLQKRGHD